MDHDERYFDAGGRRWRQSDPNIPETLRAQLVKELMYARRAVRSALSKADADAEAEARRRVHDAKVALGERGPKWWEPANPSDLERRTAAAIRSLLRSRERGKTICPSEAARVVGGKDWRDLMPLVRQTAWTLAEQGWLDVVQKGAPVQRTIQGPVRLRRPA